MATVKTAIILAGGLGTRLRSVVNDLPKCMAPVNNRPFISYVINELSNQGITHFIFALGYKSEYLISYINAHYAHLNISYSIEDDPLGTGGAIKLALDNTDEENILITNGDTLYKADVAKLSENHITNKSHCSLALKPMQNFDRYGVVETDETSRIISFKEKNAYETGTINGGLYLLNKTSFNNINFPLKFSFERDYLETYFSAQTMFGFIDDAYFIDIGIPEDFEKAQSEL